MSKSKFHTECSKSDSERKEKTRASEPQPVIQKPKDDGADLLAMLNPNRACSCEVTARALSDDVPKFLGLRERRAALDADHECDNCQMNQKQPAGSTNTNDPNPQNSK